MEGPATLTPAESDADSPAIGISPARIRQNIEEAQMLDAKLHELPEEYLDALVLVHQNFFNGRYKQLHWHFAKCHSSQETCSDIFQFYAYAHFFSFVCVAAIGVVGVGVGDVLVVVFVWWWWL